MLELQLELVHRIGVLEPMGIQVHHLFPGEKANICDDSVQRHEKDSGPVERSPAKLMRVKKQTDLFRSGRTPTRTVDANGKTTWFVYCLRRVPLPKVCTQLLGANHGSSGSGSAGSSMVHLTTEGVHNKTGWSCTTRFVMDLYR